MDVFAHDKNLLILGRVRAQVYIHVHAHMCAHVKTAEEKGERKEARERENGRKQKKLIIASVSCSLRPAHA